MSGAGVVGISASLAAAVASLAGATAQLQGACCAAGGLLALGLFFALRERGRRLRFREMERLSRSMFAAAGMRRRTRLR